MSIPRLTALLLLFNCFIIRLFAQAPTHDMYAHFIDVGRGQSILLEFPHGAILIDAGAQPNLEQNVVQYLNAFFARRADINRTLNAVMITHQHVDHDLALRDVAQQFKILDYVDNSLHDPHASGKNQVWMEQSVAGLGVAYQPCTFEQISAGGNHNGITSAIINPLTGLAEAPQIIIYSGAFMQVPPGWSQADYKDPNNHSLVIKVIYGRASFLFMGDQETSAIQTVLNYYSGSPGLLHADVLQVGHHGSANATTDAWVQAVSPRLAVISCGHWNYGMNSDGSATPFTTYAYGHPNVTALQILQQDIPGQQQQPLTEEVGVKGTASRSIKPVFESYTITHPIYATAWEGNITIDASPAGSYQVLPGQ